MIFLPISVAALPKAWTDFAHSNTEIMGSNPTGGMDFCIHSVIVPFCVYVAVLRRADRPSKEFYRLWIRLENWETGQGPTKGL
jgi:hypothetical protein